MTGQSLDQALDLALEAESGLLFRSRMRDLGELLVAEKSSPEAADRRFHVVSAVEDFEGLAAGVRSGLARLGEVSYSCLWPQFQVLSTDPRIEVCPIYKAYHQEKPQGNYTLVIVSANVGSITPLSSMITHLVYDRKFNDYRDIRIIAPVVHRNAKQELSRRGSFANIAWSEARVDEVFDDGLGTLPGLGGSVITRNGFSSRSERNEYMPEEVENNLNERRRLARAERLARESMPT